MVKMRGKPTIGVNVPTIGEGSVERAIIEKLVPIFNNIGNEMGKFHVRLSQLEQIGPSVKVNYSPRNMAEFKEALELLRPIDLFAAEGTIGEAEEGTEKEEVKEDGNTSQETS
jgi:hypothetical protein